MALGRWADSAGSGVPLVIDFDGTLCRTDSLARLRMGAIERGLEELRAAQRSLGKQHEKVFLWDAVGLDLDTLPFDDDVIAFAENQHRSGRDVVLATGSALELARAVARRLACFTRVHGSTLEENLTSERKAAFLTRTYGAAAFDYVGDSPADVPVWAAARAGARIQRVGELDIVVPANTTVIQSPLANDGIIDPTT